MHTMLKGSGELQLGQIVLLCSYVISGLLKGDLEAACRTSAALVLCCPSRRFNVLSPSSFRPDIVPTTLKVLLSQFVPRAYILDKVSF